MSKLANLTTFNGTRSKEGLLKFRLSVCLLTLAKLFIMIIILTNKNFETSEDEAVRLYEKTKFKLITVWFNLLFVAYLPLCIYCDWQELKDGDLQHIKNLHKIRDFFFTNLILPLTLFADILFWKLWYLDKDLMMPKGVHTIIHFWEQHSLHTVSLIFVIFDIICVRRERPQNPVPGLLVLLGFVTVYSAMCMHSVMNGEYLYPFLKKFSTLKLIALVTHTYVAVLFYYTGQWFVVDIIHREKVFTKTLLK